MHHSRLPQTVRDLLGRCLAGSVSSLQVYQYHKRCAICWVHWVSVSLRSLANVSMILPCEWLAISRRRLCPHTQKTPVAYHSRSWYPRVVVRTSIVLPMVCPCCMILAVLAPSHRLVLIGIDWHIDRSRLAYRLVSIGTHTDIRIGGTSTAAEYSASACAFSVQLSLHA